jgi:hypothetical protein
VVRAPRQFEDRKDTTNASSHLANVSSVAETAKFFEKIKVENAARRRVTAENKAVAVKESAGVVSDGPESSVLEFPTRRVSSLTRSMIPPPVSASTAASSSGQQANENFASAKDMWKKRESAGFNAPVLPAAFVRDQSRRDSFKLPLSESSPKNSVAKNHFWKQRESTSGKMGGIVPTVLEPTDESTPEVLADTPVVIIKAEELRVSPPRRLSMSGVSIPVIEIPKSSNSKDTFELPESEIPIDEVMARRGSQSSLERENSQTLRTSRPVSPQTQTTSKATTPLSSVRTSPRFETSVKSPNSEPFSSSPLQSISPKTQTHVSPKATPGQHSVLVETSPSAFLSPSFDSFDPERTFDDSTPIVLIEIGESEARVGVWNVKQRVFDLMYVQ